MSNDIIEFGEPEVAVENDTYTYDWQRGGQPSMRVEVTDVRNDGDRIMGGFTVWWLLDQPLGVRPVQPYTVLNLSSSHSTGWRSIPRELSKRLPDVDFEGAMTIVVDETMRRFQEGDPTIVLHEQTRSKEAPFLLEPWVSSSGVTLLYGEGGLSKSLISLALAVSISTGVPIFGKEPIKVGPVMYFDYEDDYQTHTDRLLAICKSFGIPPVEAKVFYHGLTAKVLTSKREMRRRLYEVDAVVGVLDSVGMGRGGSAVAAEDTIRMFRGVRDLGVPFIAIDHVSKSAKAEKSGEVDAYGSIYSMNSARLAWSLVRQMTNDGKIHIHATNRKHNHVPKQAPQTLAIEFVNDEHGIPNAIDIEVGNEFGMLLPAVGNPERLAMYMTHGEWRTYADAEGDLEIARTTLRSIVSRDSGETYETQAKEGHATLFRLKGEGGVASTLQHPLQHPESEDEEDRK